MIEDLADAGIGPDGAVGRGGARRTYVKPFVRNLDASETDGKATLPYELDINTVTRWGPS